MKKIGSVYIWCSLAAIVLWIVPWILGIIRAKPSGTPFTLYSCVLHDFTYLDNEGEDFVFVDRKGERHGDEVQPMFYASMLFANGSMPDSIGGRAITREAIEYDRFTLMERPGSVNRKAPRAWLLMESVPPRLDLQDPEYGMVFRRDGVHIYKMNGKEYDKAKSEDFTKSLSQLGFKFPCDLISGNPSHRKEYDEGYLLTDSEGHLFHMKMAEGKASVQRLTCTDALDLKYVTILEINNRSTIGYVVDKDDAFYVVRSDNTLVPTEVKWDPTRQSLLIVGDMFYHTVKVSDSEGETFYALRTGDYTLEDTMYRPLEDDGRHILSSYLFPFRLTFTSSLDGYVKPRIQSFSWIGLVVDLVIAGAVVLVVRTRKRKSEGK